MPDNKKEQLKTETGTPGGYSNQTELRRKKKAVFPIGKILLGLVTVLVLFLLLTLGILALWHAFLRPEIRLKAREALTELGEEYDPEAYIEEIRHADPEDLVVEEVLPEGSKIGDAEIRYSIKMPGIISSILEKVPESGKASAEKFLWREPQILIMHIQDTTAPVITLKEGTLEAVVGNAVSTSDFVESVTDEDSAAVYFADGSESYTFEEVGMGVINLYAIDPSGNRSDVKADVVIDELDVTAPKIKGAKDVVIARTADFDVMEGVTVKDNRDANPELTVEPASINTNEPGRYTITYTARDKQGNERVKTRIVTVAERVLTVKGKNYAIHWDPSGVSGQPYLVTVNRVFNSVTIYQQDDNGEYTIPVKAMVCSVGEGTPTGYYITEGRERWKYLFEDCWGQYGIRIVDNILFHSVPYELKDPSTLEYEEYNYLGTSASLGCVRLCVEDVKWIYDNCPNGFRCCIYDEESSPGPLGKPESIKIDPNDERRGWDPTDPDPTNPWNPQPVTEVTESSDTGYEESSDGDYSDEDSSYDDDSYD